MGKQVDKISVHVNGCGRGLAIVGVVFGLLALLAGPSVISCTVQLVIIIDGNVLLIGKFLFELVHNYFNQKWQI